MGAYLDTSDLTALADIDPARAAVLIEDAEVFATMAAPCLATPGNLTEEQRKQVKTVLRRAVIREADSGTGAKVQETAGPYSYTVDTRSLRGVSFLTEAEEDALRAVCGAGRSNQVFSVDVTPAVNEHLPWCDLMFLGAACSCGAALAGRPLYELADGGWL